MSNIAIRRMIAILLWLVALLILWKFPRFQFAAGILIGFGGAMGFSWGEP